MRPVDSADPSVPVQPHDWEDAARRCTARLEAERGIADEWSVTREDGVLWVNYDRFRVRVGVNSDVQTEAQLFEELDLWVADDRPGGPGRWLPRDQAALDDAWRGASTSVASYRSAGQLLAADLQRTTGVTSTWTVVLTEIVDPLAQATSPRPAAPVLMAQVVFADGAGNGHGVPPLDDPSSVTEALHELLHECEDDVIEELWGRWPLCATHVEELYLGDEDQQPTWRCPVDDAEVAVVGQLRQEQVGRD